MASQALLDFWADFMTLCCDFLMTEPIFWFVGLYVGFFVLSLLRQMMHINDKI